MIVWETTLRLGDVNPRMQQLGFLKFGDLLGESGGLSKYTSNPSKPCRLTKSP